MKSCPAIADFKFQNSGAFRSSPSASRFLNMSKLLPLAIVAALASSIAPVRGLEPRWPPGPYKYLVFDQDLKDVLTEFGRHIDVPVEVSNQVKGRLRGRLPVAGSREFLNQLCESYGLVWYFDGSTLHINAKTEVKTELINIGGLPSDQLTARLSALGIADSRFPVRSTPDGGVVSVSGPPSYIALVRQTLTALATSITSAPTAANGPTGQNAPAVRNAQPPAMLPVAQSERLPAVQDAPLPPLQSTPAQPAPKMQPPAVQSTQRVTIWRNLIPQEYVLPHGAAH